VKVSQKDFQRFQAEFEKWRKFWSCAGWDVLFSLEDLGNLEAGLDIQLQDRIVKVSLNTEVSSSVEKLAFHEATELFLGRLRVLSGERNVDPRVMDEAFHEVVHVLSGKIFLEEKQRGLKQNGY
jgi:hypothetical protein